MHYHKFTPVLYLDFRIIKFCISLDNPMNLSEYYLKHSSSCNMFATNLFKCRIRQTQHENYEFIFISFSCEKVKMITPEMLSEHSDSLNLYRDGDLMYRSIYRINFCCQKSVVTTELITLFSEVR